MIQFTTPDSCYYKWLLSTDFSFFKEAQDDLKNFINSMCWTEDYFLDYILVVNYLAIIDYAEYEDYLNYEYKAF